MGTPVRTIGYQATWGATRAGIRKGDVLDEIIYLKPPQYMMATLLLAAQKRRRIKQDYVYDIPVDPARPRYVTVTALADGTSFTVSATDKVWLQVGMECRLDYDTSVVITAMNYTTGVATVADSSGLLVGNKLVLGNPASDEYSSAPTPLTRIPDNVTNYVETLRSAYGMSRHAQNVAFFGPTRFAETRRQALEMHKEDIAKGLIGNSALSGTLTNTFYKTGGAIYLASNAGNVYTFDQNLISYDAFCRATPSVARLMPSKRLWLVCSEKTFNMVQAMCEGKVTPSTYTIERFGMNITEIQIGSRIIQLIPDDYFGGAGLENTGVLLDPAGLNLATVKNQESGTVQWMMEDKDAATPGVDGDIGVITTDFGADFVPNWCWILDGMSDYVKP